MRSMHLCHVPQQKLLKAENKPNGTLSGITVSFLLDAEYSGNPMFLSSFDIA